MDTIGILNMGQKNILCAVGIYLENAKISVEHLTEIPFTSFFFFSFVLILEINWILTSIFYRMKLYFYYI